MWVIVPLWVVLLILLIKFCRTDRASAALWAPYFAWVTFATCLNFAIWRLN